MGQGEVQAAGLGPDGGRGVAITGSGGGMNLDPREPVVELAAAPDESPAQAFLSAYFGSEAPEVRAVLAAEGVDLEVLPPPMPPEQLQAVLPEWLLFKDVERDSWRRELEAWPEVLDREWLQNRLHVLVDLSDEDLEAIDALASLYTPDINVATDLYMDALETAMLQDLQWGRIRVSPFLAWPASEPNQPNGFFSMVRAGQGWVARIALNEQAHPVAYEARAAVAREVAKRDRDLHQTLLALQ